MTPNASLGVWATLTDKEKAWIESLPPRRRANKLAELQAAYEKQQKQTVKADRYR
jgi:hypothetical protein